MTTCIVAQHALVGDYFALYFMVKSVKTNFVIICLLKSNVVVGIPENPFKAPR